MRHLLETDQHGSLNSAISADGLTAPIALKAWQGASGRWYMHTVFHFVGCPAFRSAVFLFARRAPSGRRTVLGVAYAKSDVPSVNLAALRQRGAMLGATEIHVHEVEGSVATSAQVAFDLATAVLPLADAGASRS